MVSIAIFNKHIKRVRDNKKLQECVDNLSTVNLIGLDTETANFFNGNTYKETRLALIQLSRWDNAEQTSMTIWIIEALLPDLDLYLLRPIFNNRNILKIIHNAHFDVGVIRKNLGIEVSGVWCTQIADRKGKQIGLGLANLSERYLNRKVDKTLQVSNWGAKYLTDSQIAYAATDAELVLLIYPYQLEKKYNGNFDKTIEAKRNRSSDEYSLIDSSVVNNPDQNDRNNEILWLKEFIESGRARNHHPQDIVLNSGFHFNSLYENCRSLENRINDVEGEKKIIKAYEEAEMCSPVKTCWELLHLIYCHFNDIEPFTIEYCQSEDCGAQLMDMDSIMTGFCLKCRDIDQYNQLLIDHLERMRIIKEFNNKKSLDTIDIVAV